MRNKQLPFILTAAMCLSSGVTVAGSESSEEMVLTQVQAELEGEALASADVEEEPAEALGSGEDAEIQPSEDQGTGEDAGTPASDTSEDSGSGEDAGTPASDASEDSGSGEDAGTPASEETNTGDDTEAPASEETNDGGESEPETVPAGESETTPSTETAADADGFVEEEIDADYVDEIAAVVEDEMSQEPEEESEVETEYETEAELYGYGTGSLVSDGGAGELYVAVHGYPVGDLTENEKDVYVYLRKELGLNKAAASGVLANVYFESNFSSVAVGDGGTSLGLCQWHLGRCKSLISWCDAHKVDYRSVEGQLGYLDYELNNIYKDVLGYLLGVPDTADGAYRAGYYFCMYFESPTDTKTRSEARGTMAKNSYYASDLDEYMEESDSSDNKKGIMLSSRARLIVQIDKHS